MYFFCELSVICQKDKYAVSVVLNFYYLIKIISV